LSIRGRNLTTASTGHCYCHKTCFSLRSASFAPIDAMPVKQMLDWRCARGKRRKYSSKKEISLSGREEIIREERIRKNWFVKWKRVYM